MNFCGTKPQESPTQKKINAYLQAKQVVEALKRDGKLDDLCKVKGVTIPLYKNMIGIIWSNSEIDIAFSKRQIKKISLKRIIRN